MSTLAPVQPIAPRALLDSHNRLIDLYGQQFKQAAVSGEVVGDNDQHVSYRLSTANELEQRRRTARMYLLFLAGVNAMATTGVVVLAYLSHMTSGAAQTVAVWLLLFGAVQSVVTWRTLHREQTLSPEGLHLEQIQYDAHVNQVDAQTRRLAIQYAGRAELERVRLQREHVAAQREANRRLVQDTQARVDAQMVRHTTPQNELNRLNTYRPQPRPQDARQGALGHTPIVYDLKLPSSSLEAHLETPETSMEVEPVVDPIRKRLLDFTCDLYLDRDPETGEYRRMHEDGRFRKGVVAPWSQRSDLTQAQRRQIEELLRQITPSLFIYDGDRKLWVLNLQNYRRVHHAVAAVDGALTPILT